ncbi:MAG: 1-acyl-sn-glycerol-3-phosphate acyltransferase [Desulfobacterales bacterium]|nr:MAG: 1-acyl-sn-glycerol-3-phosphate acyltransferase [Desulfobacterales bacterium]
MGAEITISIWLFVFLVAVTAWALLERVLIPSTRWFLRRRINRVIDEISTRLDIQIRPFQLTKRQVLIDRLVYDSQVIEAIQRAARERHCPREIVQAEVLAYAKEIVPSFNAYLYFRIGYWLAKKIARLMYRVRIGLGNDQELTGIDPNSAIVFVMNHRSNMDYMLAAFLAAEKTTLSYAVGEWAKIWPLQTLIRSLGAFFIRRNSGNPLYRRVLERYIQMATKEGVCQAVFLEGRITRDGCLQPPKLGLLDYMLRYFEPKRDRDIVFIPVGLNYDRTLEDRSLIRELDPQAEKRSPWFILKTTLGFMGRCLMLIVLSRWQRFGYACVQFGPYISMREYSRAHGVDFSQMNRRSRFPEIEKLANRLMAAIEKVIPILPVALVASVLAENEGEGLSAFELQARVNALIEEIQARGAPVYLSRRGRVQMILNALDTLKLRRLVAESHGVYRADPEEVELLSYYANSIAHWRQESGADPRRG